MRIERRDVQLGTRLRAWMDGHVLPAFSQRSLPVDSAVALRSALPHVPDPRPERDASIAATALVHRMIDVTRHVADGDRTGASQLNPWVGTAG